MEFRISFMVYPLADGEEHALREALQEIVLTEIERRGLYMGPLIIEAVAEVGNGEEIA